MKTHSDVDLNDQFARLSNWGRWGPADDLGTINYITPDKTLAALRLPRHGVTIGLGRDLYVGGGDPDQTGQFGSDTIQVSDAAVNDEWHLTTHGFGMTHIDALGHTLYRGMVYPGVELEDVLGDEGLSRSSVYAYRSGIITRGVLLDVAAFRGVDYLEQGDGVSVSDLTGACAAAGTRIESGDAIFIRTGLASRRSVNGFDGDEVRTGVLPEVTEWLFDSQIAIYSGDCIEQLPSLSPEMSHPLHQVGQVSMGLCTLDIPDMERLAAAATKYAANTFLVVIAPLRVKGASGSPVNPIAVF